MKKHLVGILLSISAAQAETNITLSKDTTIIGRLSQEKNKLIIHSTTGHKLIVPTGTCWDLSKEAAEIELTGTVELVVEQGAKISGNGGILRCKDAAKFIVKRSN